MQKVALILQTVASQADNELQIVYSGDAAHQLSMETITLPMEAFDEADILYCQYYRARGGRKEMWSTDILKKYYNVKVVPLLLSPISTPQSNYWNDEYPYDIHQHNWGIDFRLLELFLEGTSAQNAALRYQDVVLSKSEIDSQVKKRAKIYKERYEKGMVCFDYSSFYEERLSANIYDYYTFNHPSNVHLEWLANRILEDCGMNVQVSIVGVPDLLSNEQPPNLFGKKCDSYLFNSTIKSILSITKFYYAYFDTLDKGWLIKEFYSSSYYLNHRKPAPIPTVKSATERNSAISP